MDPEGKVAIISGGASGIGVETAKLLAANGVRIVIVDRQVEAGEAAVRELASQGGEARFVEADVTKRKDLQRAIEVAESEFGGGDIFYNNAGISERDFYTPDSDSWLDVVAINLTAVIRATQIQVQWLRQHDRSGVIINTASMGGLVPMPGSPVYAATKAGVIQFSRSLAFLAEQNIRVNVICPTFTDTPLVRQGGEAAIEAMKKEVGGILQPEQVAEGVLELVQDESRAGAVMRVTVRKGIDYTFERR